MKSKTYSDTENLEAKIVGIKIRGHKEISGTGLIISEDGLILTCYHVINSIENNSLDNLDIQAYFPELRIYRNVEVLSKYCDIDTDVAFLKLKRKKPSKAKVANLTTSIHYGREFRSVGCRKSEHYGYLTSDGKILASTFRKTIKGSQPQSIIQLSSDKIGPGMSGAPVLDYDSKQVIGIISEDYLTEGKEDRNLAFAIPIDSAVKVFPEICKKNPGLDPFNLFLIEIGENRFGRYQNLTKVYVAPKEYPDIEKALKQRNCVFIIGTPEFGKTFTAIKLLWENWHKNRSCFYPKTLQDKKDILDRLKNQDNQLKDSVIFLEDPTGQADYEHNENFEQYIMGIIKTTLPYLNSCLIITMRESVYLKTKPKILGKEDLEKLIIRLNIGKPSYDYNLRKEILIRWAKNYECKWLNNKRFADIVFQSLKEGMLPTLLNISFFTAVTGSGGKEYNIDDAEQLNNIIKIQSQSIPDLFAKAINDALDHEVLFLCFPFITEELKSDKVRELYIHLAEQLSEKKKISINTNDSFLFESAVNKFQYEINTSEYIRFTHPSYMQSLPLVLVDENGLPRGRFNDIFCETFVWLADRYDVKKQSIASTLEKVFPRLPSDVSNKIITDLCIIAANMMSNAAQFPIEPWYFDSGPYSSGWNILKIHDDANDLYHSVVRILEKYCKKQNVNYLIG